MQKSLRSKVKRRAKVTLVLKSGRAKVTLRAKVTTRAEVSPRAKVSPRKSVPTCKRDTHPYKAVTNTLIDTAKPPTLVYFLP